MLKGVLSVEPGYAGGAMPNPTYEAVSDGSTGYAEVVKVEYDASIIPLETLLTVFFATWTPQCKPIRIALIGIFKKYKAQRGSIVYALR